jgi:hypothetical protein
MKNTNGTIKALEAKGYIVVKSDNMWLGKVDESCPIVYEILNPDYSAVYGANGIAPESLEKWLDLPTVCIKNVSIKTMSAKEYAKRQKKERSYDNLYNEGTEGYNPYRTYPYSDC